MVRYLAPGAVRVNRWSSPASSWRLAADGVRRRRCSDVQRDRHRAVPDVRRWASWWQAGWPCASSAAGVKGACRHARSAGRCPSRGGSGTRLPSASSAGRVPGGPRPHMAVTTLPVPNCAKGGTCGGMNGASCGPGRWRRLAAQAGGVSGGACGRLLRRRADEEAGRRPEDTLVFDLDKRVLLVKRPRLTAGVFTRISGSDGGLHGGVGGDAAAGAPADGPGATAARKAWWGPPGTPGRCGPGRPPGQRVDDGHARVAMRLASDTP